jgi:hypothetical protein
MQMCGINYFWFELRLEVLSVCSLLFVAPNLGDFVNFLY